MKPVTILLTGCGAPGAPGIIKCLRKNGERDIRIVSVDMNEDAAARTLVDAFYTVPAAEDPGFIDRVLDICLREGVKVVFPIVTRELEVFSAAKARFEEIGVKVNVMDPGPLHTANNKGLLLSAMKDAGLPTPEFRIAHTADEVETAVRKLGYPQKAVVVKPTFGNGSRGTRILDPEVSRYDLLFRQKPNSMYISFSGLMEILREPSLSSKDTLFNNAPPPHTLPEMMVMEYLPGQEYGVDALCDQGDPLIMTGRYNFSVNSSIPKGCILESRAEPFEIAKKLIKILKLSGNVNFDFKYDRQEKARLIEINPRLSATIVSYAPAGVNLPYLSLKRLLGESLPACAFQEGIMMRRRNVEVFFDAEGNEISW